MSSWVGADQFQSNASAAASDTSKTRGAQRHHRRQKWGLDGDEILVTLLKEEYATTRGQASSFKCEVWSRIATAFSEKAKESVTGIQLKNRWKYIKKIYRLYASLVNKSGWTWDYAQHRPTPDSIEVWDDVIKFNKDYKTARDRSFPLYWLVHELAGASSATGRFAVDSTEERTVVDVEGSGSSASIPVEQDFDGNGGVHMGGRDESDVYRSGTKRKK
ncbi:hypothetical protein J5N97_006442 [Dioscorea zingiberensis]|uniref:Myb/SANT-like domain-containing protein n=1 Tax=Dioscorea zingiberensis TaxID=325984 RepID=A0A9D5DA21_9LILI|nr:hypothetical protein J5N97_006442 [Dioscorea zingiberensis]